MTDLLRPLLEALVPEPPEYVVCHLSLERLGLTLAQAREAADELLDFLGPRCTLAIPSFPFGPNVVYAAFLGQERLVYDRTLTPCRVNIFGEVFRRRTGVQRALDPILPFAVAGPGGEELIAEDHLDDRPFGPRTSFAKLGQRKTLVLGLGVDLNTNGLFHLLDDPFVDRLPFPVYSETPKVCTICDQGRLLMSRAYHYVLPALRRRIKPRLLHPVIRDQAYYRFVGGDGQTGPLGYSLEAEPFVAHGRELARRALAENRLPVWHRQS